MHIEDHVKVALPVVAVDEPSNGVDGGLAETVGVVPMPVEILAQQVAHRVAQKDSVGIHHWHKLKNQKPESKQLD